MNPTVFSRAGGGTRLKQKENRNRKAPDARAEPNRPPEAISSALGVPAALFGGGPQIALSGNREALVEGCQGVIEYDETVVKLAAGKLAVRFSGRNLQIKVLTHDSALVEGFITSVEFIA